MSAPGSFPTVGAALAEAEDRLAAAGLATPRVDAEWLLAGILDVGRNALAINARRPLAELTATRYAEAVRRRAGREPLQRILGWEEFRGLRFRLTPEVLVPRPETELLVEWSLAVLPSATAGRPTVIDVGTGSGCIACAIAHARPDVDVVAVDVAPAAAATARTNVRALGLERSVRVVVADLLTALGAARAALIVANLPYLATRQLEELEPEVRLHDPGLALAGGRDGLAVIRQLVSDARRALRRGGALLVETAGAGQAPGVAALFGEAGLVDVTMRADLAGISRFVGGRVA